jgi:hypothetical protein
MSNPPRFVRGTRSGPDRSKESGPREAKEREDDLAVDHDERRRAARYRRRRATVAGAGDQVAAGLRRRRRSRLRGGVAGPGADQGRVRPHPARLEPVGQRRAHRGDAGRLRRGAAPGAGRRPRRAVGAAADRGLRGGHGPAGAGVPRRPRPGLPARRGGAAGAQLARRAALPGRGHRLPQPGGGLLRARQPLSGRGRGGWAAFSTVAGVVLLVGFAGLSASAGAAWSVGASSSRWWSPSPGSRRWRCTTTAALARRRTAEPPIADLTALARTTEAAGTEPPKGSSRCATWCC